jgi:hypothetical protein
MRLLHLRDLDSELNVKAPDKSKFENRGMSMHVLKAMGPINNGPNSPDFCSLWMAVGR